MKKETLWRYNFKHCLQPHENIVHIHTLSQIASTKETGWLNIWCKQRSLQVNKIQILLDVLFIMMKLKERLSVSERLSFFFFQNLYPSFQFHFILHISFIHCTNMNIVSHYGSWPLWKWARVERRLLSSHNLKEFSSSKAEVRKQVAISDCKQFHHQGTAHLMQLFTVDHILQNGRISQ